MGTLLLFSRETDEETDGEKTETNRHREGARDIKRRKREKGNRWRENQDMRERWTQGGRDRETER